MKVRYKATGAVMSVSDEDGARMLASKAVYEQVKEAPAKTTPPVTLSAGQTATVETEGTK